VETKSENRG